MKQNLLGNTGIRVSELSCGTLILGKLQAELTVEEGARVLKKAIDLGINFFDTAAPYGTFDHLREGLRGTGDKMVVSSKTKAKTREDAQKDLETCLRELDRECIDVYHLWDIISPSDLKDRREALDFLLECKQRGLIKAVGAAVHKVESARAVVEESDIEILFPIVNLKSLGITDGGSVNDMIEVCWRADQRGMGIMVMKPLAGGHLRKSPGEAFNFLRNFGMFDSICVGMKSPAEVEMNVSLFEGRKVSIETLAQLETVPRHLRISGFCKGCGACVEVCTIGALSVDFSQANESIGKKGQSVVDRDKCILCGYCTEPCPVFALRVV